MASNPAAKGSRTASDRRPWFKRRVKSKNSLGVYQFPGSARVVRYLQQGQQHDEGNSTSERAADCRMFTGPN